MGEVEQFIDQEEEWDEKNPGRCLRAQRDLRQISKVNLIIFVTNLKLKFLAVN